MLKALKIVFLRNNSKIKVGIKDGFKAIISDISWLGVTPKKALR